MGKNIYLRARRKALKGARKPGLINLEMPFTVALEELHEGINPNDFARLENEGGPGAKFFGAIEEESPLRAAKADSSEV